MEEKKNSLDELPDNKDPSSETISRPAHKKPSEPRLEKLKNLDDDQRVHRMTQRWHFDRKERTWGWALSIVVLFIVEQMRIYQRLMQDASRASEATLGMSDVFFEMFELVEFFLLHPIVLAVFIPILFKFAEKSENYFDVTFDGVETVKEVFPTRKEPKVRVRVKWNDIGEVKKTSINNQEVLQLYSAEGKLAEIIWFIDINKKMAIRQLCKAMLNQKHPFRTFIEKEIK